MIDLEKLCNINRREKLKTNKNTRPPSINSFTFNSSLTNLASNQDSVRNLVYFGSSGLGFTIYDNHVLFSYLFFGGMGRGVAILYEE